MACASTTLGGLSPNLSLLGREVRPVGEILRFSSIQAWWDPSHVRVMSMIPFVCPDSVSQRDRSSFSDYCLGFLVFKVAFVCNMSFGSYSDLERQTGAITGRKCKLGGAMNDSPGPGSFECGSPACPLLFKLGPPLRKAPQSQAGDGCSLSVSRKAFRKGTFFFLRGGDAMVIPAWCSRLPRHGRRSERKREAPRGCAAAQATLPPSPLLPLAP